MDFQPTYLMIKRHQVTGLMYFCKTTQKYPEKYKGSGRYWMRHMKVHGRIVETLWYELFDNKDDLTEFALFFSEFHNIVKSKHWANEIPEDGLQGGQNRGMSGPGVTMYGKKHSDVSKEKMTFLGEENGMFGRKHTDVSIELMKSNRPDQTGAKNPCARPCHTPVGDFGCVMEAAAAMKVSDTTLRKRLKSTDEKFKEYYYKEIK